MPKIFKALAPNLGWNLLIQGLQQLGSTIYVGKPCGARLAKHQVKASRLAIETCQQGRQCGPSFIVEKLINNE